MTDQPDAYHLAAMAAADRARAEATQRPDGETAGPGLQNPVRKLLKIPGARWILSSIVIAAGVGLAVDYVNTPLKPWFQYQAKVPLVNQGKSVAQVAAEESAKPAADINTQITTPAQNEANTDAQKMSDSQAAFRRVIGISASPSDQRLGSAGVQMFNMPPLLRRHLEEYGNYLPLTADDLSNGEGFIGDTPIPMPAAQLAPLLFKDHSLVTINGRSCEGASCATTTWLFVRFTDGREAIVRRGDFDRLKVARQPLHVAIEQDANSAGHASPTPPLQDLGTMGLSGSKAEVRAGTIYFFVPETGAWKKSIWSNCTLDGSAADQKYACVDTSGTWSPGRFIVHLKLAAASPSPDTDE